MPKLYLMGSLALAVLAGACAGNDKNASASLAAGCTLEIAPSSDDQNKVQGALVHAKEDDVICFGAGTFHFADQLSLNADRITLRGVDGNGTVFDFSAQTSSASGIEVTGNGDSVESLTIIDTKGDGVRASDVNGVAFRKLHVDWSRGPDAQNGGCGLCSVSSSRVLIEDCSTSGASHAGIYISQSQTIIVRASEAAGNVAGIELENSNDSELSDNDCHDNTAGILVFNVPGLGAEGSVHADVHDNRLEHNNQGNFAADGGIIDDVPSGTGLLVLAADANQLHANHISDNHSFGISVLSWYAAQRDGEGKADPKYDFYPESNYVFDNDMSNNGDAPRDRAASIAAMTSETRMPDIAWDGTIDWEKYYPDGVPSDPDPGWIPVARRNCFKPGSASFLNLDLGHDGANKSASPGAFECEQASLPAIKL